MELDNGVRRLGTLGCGQRGRCVGMDGPKHSLQQLKQPLPILQPEVFRQVLLFHDAQTHGGSYLTA